MVQKILNLKNKIIGKGKPIFIIAEAGVNHNNNLSLAFKMIDTAKKSGADSIKFQTFKYVSILIFMHSPRQPYKELYFSA